MRLISALSILILMLNFSCNKNESENCTFDTDSYNPTCEKTDTVDSVNGFIIEFYANGIDKKSEGNYTNGVPNGFWKTYYSNGNLANEGNYTKGALNGYWNTYYKNGNIRMQGHYSNCKKTGYWKYFYSESDYAVKFEGDYLKNKRKKTWRKYNLAGEQVETYYCD